MHFLSDGEERADSVESEQKVAMKKRSTTDVTFLIFMTFFYIILVRVFVCTFGLCGSFVLDRFYWILRLLWGFVPDFEWL